MPAWLLINMIGKNHPDATTDLRAMYKRGDVVDVHPPTWIPGNKEGLPQFGRLLVNDKPAPFLAKYLLSGEEPSGDSEDPAPRRTRRRRYRINIQDLPPPVRNGLNNAGEADINWRALRDNIVEKGTLQTERTRD